MKTQNSDNIASEQRIHHVLKLCHVGNGVQ